MTDTAKPTLGPWYFCSYPAGNGGFVYAGGPGGPTVCDVSQYEMPKQNGEFIAEAGTVYHETNLTPRQLLERWKHWEHVADVTAKEAQIAVNAIREQRDELRNALDELFGASISRSENGLSEALTKARAALGKHGEDV